jgi:hypothetical protein
VDKNAEMFNVIASVRIFTNGLEMVNYNIKCKIDRIFQYIHIRRLFEATPLENLKCKQ